MPRCNLPLLQEPQPPTQKAKTAPQAKPAPQVEPKVIYGKQIKETYQAKVIRVIDGDSVKILKADKTEHNCRLESIDCPETGSKNIPGQAFAKRATEFTKELTAGKMVTVHQTGIDRYKRPLAFVEADGIMVNMHLVAHGLAWVYRDYNDDPEQIAIEQGARERRWGLWADNEPMPPWQWRKRK